MLPLPLFKCLADDTRLKIVLLLCQTDSMCVCDLTQGLQLSQPKVSRHLAELRKCELLTDERRGKWVYYRLNPSLPAWVYEVIKTTALNNQEYFSESMQLTGSANCCD
ncbi:metalloregulator ArsR/SmtB family transcription factor [Gayadomonas joobiniege]|uniref:metalloregulator ArsR/SmtB family transcription factor n=1 Tax=Gayadomonas joobiniege TaxID=1234606 RepID=UPI00038078FC|nr:metalloregulator ArsR/SmtB family transcription factor [Gayadomonas joobiniege]